MKHFPALWALYVQDREAFNWTSGHIVLLTYEKGRGGGVSLKNASVWFSRAIDTLYRYAVSSVGTTVQEQKRSLKMAERLGTLSELRDRAGSAGRR